MASESGGARDKPLGGARVVVLESDDARVVALKIIHLLVLESAKKSGGARISTKFLIGSPTKCIHWTM